MPMELAWGRAPGPSAGGVPRLTRGMGEWLVGPSMRSASPSWS
jgi:hypothetical protein